MSHDVIVVGGGGAGMCAALSARENGAKVLVLERAPREKRGGNTAFAGGTFRMVHHGADDIRKVVPDLTEQEIASTDFGEYTAEQYFDDLGRITQYHSDPELSDVLIHQSADTVDWLHKLGVRFLPNYGRQAFKVDGRFKFFGGSVIYANGGGEGLMEAHFKNAERLGIDVRYSARAVALLRGANGVEGVRAEINGVPEDFPRASGGAGVRRLRGQPRMAGALSRPGLGHGEGARHPLQHRRRHPHGARHRRAALRPVVGLPFLRLGAQRRRLRQRRDTPQRLPPQLSLRHHGQRRGQALPRRRRRLPQLTPTRNTAASCCSSPAATPGRYSTHRSSL